MSLAAAAILMTAWTGCSEPAAETEPVAVSEPAEAEVAHDPGLVRLDREAVRIAGITLADVEIRKLEEELQVAGRITVNEDVTARVGSFAEGVVVSCCESVGTDVEKGHVLARLRSPEVHDAEASYRQARAELGRRQTELQFAEKFYKRASRLYELKAGSLQKVQEAEARFRSAETLVKIARAGVERADNHLRYLGLTPEQLPEAADEHAAEGQGAHEEAHLIEVRSPVAGTIIERTVSAGAVVTPSDSLYVISDLRSLWVIAQVPEQHLSLLRSGLTVEVSVRAYPDKTFPARITTIGDALDPETRTVEVRCELNNPGRQLKTEMFATLTIHTGGSREAVVAPLEALQNVDGEEVLFVPEGRVSFRVRRVRVGRHSDSVVEIVSGLQAGEKVVVAGAFRLKSELLKAQMIEE
jgi:multidrug efflux pump subunit AcrA (membrane-fusion protein)